MKSAQKLWHISGGVSCNHELRERMRIACEEAGLKFVSARPELCTDNAAMIAFVALLRLQAGFTSHVEEDIDPNLALVGSQLADAIVGRYQANTRVRADNSRVHAALCFFAE